MKTNLKFLLIAAFLSVIQTTQATEAQVFNFRNRHTELIQAIQITDEFAMKIKLIGKFNDDIRTHLHNSPSNTKQWGELNEYVTYLDVIEQITSSNMCSEVRYQFNSVTQNNSTKSARKTKLSNMAILSNEIFWALCSKHLKKQS